METDYIPIFTHIFILYVSRLNPRIVFKEKFYNVSNLQ